MAQYIDKSALVAEIDRRIQFFTEESGNSNSDIVIALFGLKSFLDTLEVKEIDFHKELLSFYKHTNDSGSEIALAKHFYELGIKAAQNEHKSCTTDE